MKRPWVYMSSPSRSPLPPPSPPAPSRSSQSTRSERLSHLHGRPLTIPSGLLEACGLTAYLSLWAVNSVVLHYGRKKKPKQRKYFYPFKPFYPFIPFNKNDHLSMYFLELLEHVPAIIRVAHFVQNTARIFLKIYGQLIKPLFLISILWSKHLSE